MNGMFGHIPCGSLLRMPALRTITCHDLIITQVGYDVDTRTVRVNDGIAAVVTCRHVLVDVLVMLLPDGPGVGPYPYRPYRELDLSWTATYPHVIASEFPLRYPPHVVAMVMDPFSLSDARVARRQHSSNPDLRHLILNGRWLDEDLLMFMLPRLTALQSISLKGCCHINGQPWNPQQLEYLVWGVAPNVTVHV